MRLLLVSDLHYSLPQLDWVVGVASEYDLVVIAGDHLDISSALPLDAQSLVILRYLDLLREAGRVVVSSGNHDLTGPDANGEQAALWLAAARSAGIPTDGDSLVLPSDGSAGDGDGDGDRDGATLVTICPWWDGPIGREATDAQLAADAVRRPERWLWVYHWPPVGSPTCWTGSRHYGDADLVGWIDRHRPDIVLSGHVHQPPFKPDGAWADRIGDTWVFNPGKQSGPIPTHIELDIEPGPGPTRGSARWWSMMGSEEIDLSAPVTPPRTVF